MTKLIKDFPKRNNNISKRSKQLIIMPINKPQVSHISVASYLVFKIIDSSDAVVKATWMHLCRILKSKYGVTCNRLIGMLIIEETILKHLLFTSLGFYGSFLYFYFQQQT